MAKLCIRVGCLLVFTLAGCYKSRENVNDPRNCARNTPDYALSLRPSTDTIDFRGNITEATVQYTVLVHTNGGEVVDLSAFAGDTTYFNFDARGDGNVILPVTSETFSYTVTQPGVYRSVVVAGTCRQSVIQARAAVVARNSFSPILTVETIPDISQGVNVNQEIVAIFTVVDRDGSQVFDLTYDPDGDDGPIPAMNKNLWDITVEPTFETRFTYANPGLVTFDALVTDEQDDQTNYLQNAAVGLVGIFDGLIQNTVSPSSIRALKGYSDSASETVWAVASGTGGLRMYAYDASDGALHLRGQLAGEGPVGSSVQDLLYDPVSKVGWVTVSADGLYGVDLSDLTQAKYRVPYDQHYPVYDFNVQRSYGLAHTITHEGRNFGVVGNSGSGEFHLLRWDSAELSAQRDSGVAFDASAVCQVTNAKLYAIKQCECVAVDDACASSHYAERHRIGPVQDVAWIPPYLAFVGDSQFVRLYDASEAITAPRAFAVPYVITDRGSFQVPATHAANETNYGSGITGRVLPANPNTIEWYVSHSDHGLAFGQTDVTTDTSDLLGGWYGNFHAERRAGLVGQTTVGYDSFRAARMVNDQVVIADQYGESRSSLLTLDPEEWKRRDPQWGFFYYEYSQKCLDFDIRDDTNGLYGGTTLGGGNPITYITDCIPMVAEKIDVVDGYVGAIGGDQFYLANIGTIPLNYNDLGYGGVVTSMSLNGPIVQLTSFGERLFVARLIGGLEIWDLSATGTTQQLLPRIVDGLHRNYSIHSIWPTSRDALWVSNLETLEYWQTGGHGWLSSNAVTEIVLPEPYSQVVLDTQNKLAYGLARDDGKVQVTDIASGPTQGDLRATSVNSGYSSFSLSSLGQLVAARFTQNSTRVYEWLSPQLSVLALLQQAGTTSQSYVAHGQDRLFVLETLYDGTLDHSTLKMYVRDSASVTEVHAVFIPAANSYMMTGTQMAIVGNYLAVLFKGTNRGIYLFDISDPGQAPEFVASSLRADMGLMDLFQPVQLGANLAMVGATNGGFHAGKMDFVRFLFQP